MTYNGFVNSVSKGKSSTQVVNNSEALITVVNNGQVDIEVENASTSTPTECSPTDDRCHTCGRPFHPVQFVRQLAPELQIALQIPDFGEELNPPKGEELIPLLGM